MINAGVVTTFADDGTTTIRVDHQGRERVFTFPTPEVGDQLDRLLETISADAQEMLRTGRLRRLVLSFEADGEEPGASGKEQIGKSFAQYWNESSAAKEAHSTDEASRKNAQKTRQNPRSDN